MTAEPVVEPLTRWTTRWTARDEGDVPALQEALQGSTLSGESPLVGRYEEALATWFGSRHAVAVSSGSAAIQLTLIGLGAVAGTEVLVPAIAPLPSMLPLLRSGATPVVVDTARDHLAFDPDDLARKITPRTRAALAVELWGYPQDFGPTLEVLERHGIPLVEDSCQAHGTTIGGVPAGRVGRAGCFSTHNFKFVATGEGGFVLTDDAQLADFVDRYARLGRLDGVHQGMNFKLSGLAAALGRHRLRLLAGRVARQRANAARILESIADAPLSEFPAASYGAANGYSLVLLLDRRVDAEAVSETLAAHGLPTDRKQFGYDIVYRRPMFAELSTRCPNAESIVDRSIQLPCHPGLSGDDLTAIGELVATAAKRSLR